MSDSAPATLYIVYSGQADARFDQDYYLEHHLPKVREAWKATGLTRVSVLFSASLGQNEAGTIAIAEAVFKNEDALQACLDAPGTGALMGDVANFTDIEPGLYRTVPLFTD
ncbi:EthD family reductase [Larsenimonas salina]|uniref:EthD family reductase n=1 Tax=Larsenimonas salina TaxID=1295565 RepID=UPI002074870D|nr:EthD family reductase [Larsenimonas salina]MCM5704435.1 EthD domain-containing protein [Larsenimonas salina]